jgi:multidrug efflux pump subunit AcrA (membrane-fusion protein)
MFAHADVTFGVARGALVVPHEALLESPGGAIAYRLRSGRAEAVHPRLGGGDAARAVVLAGLLEGDEVATSGLAALADGAPVRVAPPLDAARADAR